MHSRRRPVRETSRTHDCKNRKKNNSVHLDLLLLRRCHLGQPGRQASCHSTSPTQRGNNTTGWLRTITQWRLELCTCNSCRFLVRLVLRRIIRTYIKVRGRCPLPLLVCLQYLIQIFFPLLLIGILIVCFFRVVRFLSFFLCLLRATLGGCFSCCSTPSWHNLGSLLHLGQGRCNLSSSRLPTSSGASDTACSWATSAACTFGSPS